MRSGCAKKGRCLNGAYWCASSPVIIVDNINRERIEQVVDELIENKTFEYVFEYFGPVQERDLSRTGFEDRFFNKESKIESSIVSRHAIQLKKMLDQASDEVKTIILNEVFGVSQ